MQSQKALLLLQVSSARLFVYLRQSITSIFGLLLDLLDIDEKPFGLFLAS
jgi:hypothetical protein